MKRKLKFFFMNPADKYRSLSHPSLPPSLSILRPPSPSPSPSLLSSVCAGCSLLNLGNWRGRRMVVYKAVIQIITLGE
jgi:hypothetical protein